MGKCFIDFSVIQQDLRRTDKNTVAADAAETVAARFDLGSKWDGLKVYARFQHGPEVYDVPLVDGCATIPHEVMRETGFNVSVFGEDASGARLTSARVFVDVEPTISNDGAPPIPATPSLLQRIDALVHASSESAYNAAESAKKAQEANAATVEVDGVDTLPAGSAATVSNLGTEQHARLRFGIPKGDKGDNGSGGGVPEGGQPGQVIVKTETGEGWTDANDHRHDAGDITTGTMSADRLPVVPVTNGGTGATTAEQACANIGAAKAAHTHNAADITTGTMSADRLPVAGIAKGGTGGTTAKAARDNLLYDVTKLNLTKGDFAFDNNVIVYAMVGDAGTHPTGRMFKFDIKNFWLWLDPTIRDTFGFSAESALGIANGGTGATTAEQARANIGAAKAAHTHNAADIAGGTMPIGRGGTGATSSNGARANLKAAARGWTKIVSSSGTTATKIDLTDYYEVIVVGHNGAASSYISSCILPVGQITDTPKEVYIGGGFSEGGDRKACAKLSKTKFNGVQMVVDGKVLSNPSWLLYAR